MRPYRFGDPKPPGACRLEYLRVKRAMAAVRQAGLAAFQEQAGQMVHAALQHMNELTAQQMGFVPPGPPTTH